MLKGRQAAVTVVVVLLAHGAASGRQAPVRSSVPLPAPAADIAAALGLSSDDRGVLLLDLIRRLYDVPEGGSQQEAALYAKLTGLFGATARHESVPLPLTVSLWRDTILEHPVQDHDIVAAIVGSRTNALLYHGLAALDDETLAWLAADRETLRFVRNRPGAFAVFGRSVHMRGGRIAVPGGSEMEPIWRAIVGADPSQPGEFVRRLFPADKGRIAFFYDTLAHLDPPRLRFALGGETPSADRAAALLDVFRSCAREWDIEARPFTRPQIDPSITLSTLAVSPDGRPLAPAGHALWDRVLRDDGDDVAFADVAPQRGGERSDPPIDAAWLASRIHLVPYSLGRRRFDTVLYAQRVLGDSRAEPHEIATVLRALTAMPALLRTLERMGIGDVGALLAASRHARALNGLDDEERRRTAVMQFQATLGLLDRAVWSRAVSRDQASALLTSLVALPVSDGRGYEGRLAEWISTTLLASAPKVEASEPLEAGLLALVAGVGSQSPRPLVEWEGRRYRVDFAVAELWRIQRIREQQETAPLDVVIGRLAAARRAGAREADRAERALAETLVSILYAVHLGPPEGTALSGGDVSLRHDLDVSSALTRVRAAAAWRLPVEMFGHRLGWRVSGSLLGLDVALRRLSMRRLDPSVLPPGPRLPLLDRQTLMLTAVLFNPRALTDDTRDGIASALARGRARVVELTKDRGQIDAVVRDGALSEWRREALRWTLDHAPDRTASYFAPLELFWLGRANAGGATPERMFDPWGGAIAPLTGCLCLEMPSRRPWEELAGRRASGVLGSRGVDVALQIADTLSTLKLPASLAAAILGFAMQEVADDAQAGYFSDWGAFGRAVLQLSRDRIVDYIAALTAHGPLVPAASSGSR